jgi:hypothetical protein
LQKSILAVAMFATALFFLSAAQAQAASDATCTLVMPSGIDPTRLTFIQPGLLYTNADGTLPGDQLGAPITGNLLLTSAFSGGGGLELHGAIPGSNNANPIREIDFFTDYTGTLEVNTEVDPTFSFQPWNVQALGAVPGGFAQGFRVFEQRGSADMNSGQFYGVLSATLDDPSDPTGFRDANFGFEGFSTLQGTPEPGAFALFAGMGLTASLLALKRRRR